MDKKHIVTDEDKADLGKRFAACRDLLKMKQEVAARQLGVTKAALSAWETGRNMPDPFMLKKLAKLYKRTVDSLLSEGALSMDAMRVAAQFDGLGESQKATLMTVLTAFLEQRPTAVSHPNRRATDLQLVRK